MKDALKYDQGSSSIPADKQAQNELLITSRGFAYSTVSKEMVDPSPLPWEYEASIDALSMVDNQPVVRPEEKDLLQKVVEVLAPMFEDIVVAGLISSRWNRANANKSTYFKCYHLYCPEHKNAPELAELMQRPRVIPQRYAKKFAQKKRSYLSPQRQLIVRQLLENELAMRTDANSFQDAVIDLYRQLKTFLAAMVNCAPWDSYDLFDICAEIYRDISEYPEHMRIHQLLRNNGCALSSVLSVLSLIGKFKEMEKENETF